MIGATNGCIINTMNLSQRIKHARNARDMNMSEVARAIGVKPQAVRKWENGGGVRPEHEAPLADALRVSYQWLFTGLGQMDAEPLSSEELRSQLDEQLKSMSKADLMELLASSHLLPNLLHQCL